MGLRPYCSSRMEVSYCYLWIWCNHSAPSAHIIVTAWFTAWQPICMRNLSSRRKGNSHLTKSFGGLSYEKIWRYNNSPPYVTTRLPPRQIPPLNFLAYKSACFNSESTSDAISLPFSSLMVAYWLLANGHADLLHKPVKLYSLRQKWCVVARTLNEQNDVLIIDHITYGKERVLNVNQWLQNIIKW